MTRGFHPSPLHEAEHLTYVSLPPCCQGWGWTLLSEILLSSGSLCLFAIFVLIIIFWAYLLKKVEEKRREAGHYRFISRLLQV